MAIITTPGAGVSPYETTTTTPAVLRAGADGSTTLAVVADTATGSNTSVYVSGQAALNSLITSSQPGVFEGANVTINLEEQLFNTTNQVTATTNYPSGNTGEIQYNSGANSFASDAYFTYTNSNVITPGIRTNNYLYANGAPFLAGGNAAIGNFVFTGDNMTIAHANSTLNINGNGTGNVNVTANGNTWTFGSTGILTLPGGPRIVPVGANIELQAAAGGYAEIVTSDGNNYVAVTGSDAQIVTSGINTWTFDNVGNLILPGNTFAVKYANGDTVAISSGGFPLANGTSNIDIATANGNVTVGVSGNTWTFDNTSALIFPSGAEITSDNTGAAVFQHEGGVTIAETNGNAFTYNSVLELYDNAIHIGTDQQGNAYSWDFSQDGSMTVPGNISGANVITANVFTALSNVSITSSGNTWTFDTAGVLTVPGEGIINSIDDTVTLRSSNTSSGNANSVYLGTSGGLGFSDQSIGANWLEIFRSGIDPQLGTTGNLLITTDSSNTATTWTFDNQGNLTLPGSLIVPANSIITGVGASPAPSINGFNNIDAIAFSASGNVTANNISLTGNGFVSFTSGSTLTFGDTPVTNRYYVDATRTSETYVRNGSQARPFNTIAAAQSAIATAIAGGLNPEVEPIYIILLSNITENVTLATNHVYLVGQNGQIHQPIILTGNVIVQPTSGTLNNNHFSISGIEVVGGTNGKAIYVTGTFPTRLSLQDMWITANGNSGAGLYQDNSGTGTYTHGGPIKVSHNGTGDVYCFDIRAGTASFESVETSGATQVGAAGPGATLTFNNSQLDANGDVVVETYGNGVVVVTNSVIKNSAANSYGIKLNAVANVAGTVSVGQSAFNVPIGTGQAVWLDPNTTPGLSGVFAWSGASFYPNTNTTIAPLAIPGPLAVLVGTIASPILYGDITSYSVAQDWDLIDNNASALSFDTTGKSGVLELVTTNSAEGVKMSGFASVAGNVTGGNVLTVGAVKTGSFVTGTIPAASGVGAGARAFVTDADSITFGNLYVGGAANAMPVWSNGTNWYIG